jgi:hypothetical protein
MTGALRIFLLLGLARLHMGGASGLRYNGMGLYFRF